MPVEDIMRNKLVEMDWQLTMRITRCTYEEKHGSAWQCCKDEIVFMDMGEGSEHLF